MIEFAVYVTLGVITSFIVFWISYKACKERLSENDKYRSVTHDAVKELVVKEDIGFIVASGFFWPIVLFGILPIYFFITGVGRGFNWMIDRIEGRKYK